MEIAEQNGGEIDMTNVPNVPTGSDIASLRIPFQSDM